MKKEKQESPAKSVKKTATKSIQLRLIKTLKTITSELGHDVIDIEKEAKKLAKKITKNFKPKEVEKTTTPAPEAKKPASTPAASKAKPASKPAPVAAAKKPVAKAAAVKAPAPKLEAAKAPEPKSTKK